MTVTVKSKHTMLVDKVDCLNCGKQYYAPPEIVTCPKCFSSVPGLHVVTFGNLLPKGEEAEWCEGEYEDNLTTLFVGYAIPAELEYKLDVLLAALDELGFQRTERDGDIVHIVSESAQNAIQEWVEEINHKHDFDLTLDFESWYGPVTYKVILEIKAGNMDAVCDALTVATNQINEGFTSGFDRNEDGRYAFNIEEVRG